MNNERGRVRGRVFQAEENQMQKKSENKFDLLNNRKKTLLWLQTSEQRGQWWEMSFEDQSVRCFVGQVREIGFYSECEGVSL